MHIKSSERQNPTWRPVRSRWTKRHIAASLAFGLGFGSLATYLITPSSAATTTTMYLAPASSNVTVGSDFAVAVRINAGEAINAVEADLNYDASQLQFVGISAAGSAFSTQAPSSGGNGTVSINRDEIGGTSGDQLIATVTFKALAANAASAVTFDNNSQALRDSDSSNALGSATGGTYALIVPASPTPPPSTPTPSPVSPGAKATSSITPSTATKTPTTSAVSTPVATPGATPTPTVIAPLPTTTVIPKKDNATAVVINTKKANSKAALWGMGALLLIAAAAVAGTIMARRKLAYVVPVNKAVVMGQEPEYTAPQGGFSADHTPGTVATPRKVSKDDN